jgi:ubiquinone/menaquinone biosynthesis C-methylase UbiE
MTLWDESFTNKKLEDWFYGSDSLNGATRKWFIDRLKEYVPGTSLLDLGCGGGVTPYQMNENDLLNKIKYTGVDSSEKMLKLASNKNPKAKFVLSPIEYFDEGKFDIVLLRAVLEHILDPKPVMKSAARATKKGGEIYVIFWNNPSCGNSVIKTIECGFYDNSHSAKMLEAEFGYSKVFIKEKFTIKEKSKNSGTREIWRLERE